MSIEENSLSKPPILSETGFEPSVAPSPPVPPSLCEEKLVVPPILSKEQKNPSRKSEKKTVAQALYAWLAWLAREEMVGTWTSFAFHFFLLMLLAFTVYRVPQLPQGLLVGGFSTQIDGIDDGDAWKIKINETPSAQTSAENPGEHLVVVDNAPENVQPVSVTAQRESSGDKTASLQHPLTFAASGAAASTEIDPAQALQNTLQNTLQSALLSAMQGGGGFAESRTEANRGRRGGPVDPTDGSEAAVEAGLRWLAEHQDSDGGWSFDLGNCGKIGKCSRPGTHSNRNAATAIAVLPFLGAGYTHLEGQYRRVIERGLRFLLDSRNSVEMSLGNDFTRQDPQGMYAQGIVALALCEAYGMSRGKAGSTRDRELEMRLRDAAQNAIRYIEAAQIQQGRFVGGWRYTINSPIGDLSVSGWQMLALKSALLSGLEVKSTTLTRAEQFLNSTQYDEGRRFDYLPRESPKEAKYPDSAYTCTAIGLLVRMYLGAKPGFRPLDDGIGYLDHWGGLKSDRRTQSAGGHCNLYYAYYGTLAMKHYGGSGWVRWYPELREFLVQTQATRGHEAGSWFFPDPYCDVGGRLLNTSLGIMILEAPYRYISLYDAGW